AREHAPWIIVLAIIGIIYGALVAMVQPNMKKLIAYSSVSHLGFVVLGIFSFTQAGLVGAVFVMLAHGVSTGALFMLAGVIYERRHTYDIREYGGLATPMPAYATLFLIITLASIGLPLLNGFVGEFLVLSGAFQSRALYGVLGATGVIWSACYMLWLYQRVFWGQVKNPVNAALPDLSGREKISLWPAAAVALVMGVAPLTWISAIDPAAGRVLESSTAAMERLPQPCMERRQNFIDCHPERARLTKENEHEPRDLALRGASPILIETNSRTRVRAAEALR